MTDASRTQGWAICIGAGLLGFLFLLGILSESYWALALPVAILVFFALGLAAWVGFTIATIQVEPEAAQVEPEAAQVEPEVAQVEPEAARVEPGAARAEPEVATSDATSRDA